MLPTKAGLPTYNLLENEQTNVNSTGLTTNQLLYESVITKCLYTASTENW